MMRVAIVTPRALSAILLFLVVFAALVGPRGVDSTQLLHDLHQQGTSGWGWRVLVQLRLPRVLIAAVIGASLSMVGVVLQTWLRNPIADAGVLGISSWGALGAVLALYLGFDQAATWAQPVLAATGALVALAVLLAAAGGEQSSERVLMLGIGLGGVGSSLVSLVLSWSLPDWKASRQILAWLLGGLEGRTWVHAGSAFPLALCGAWLLGGEHRNLDALRLGRLQATSLGVDVRRVEWRIIIGTGLICGAAAAAAGAIGFIGIIVPYATRSMHYARHRGWLAVSSLFGACFLVLADLIARRAPGNSELQLGVLTGLLGAPVLLFQLLRKTEQGAC